MALLATVLVVSGCSDDEPDQASPAAAPSETQAPAYDAQTFTAAYDGGVADPRTGRIGYVMTDPAAAAQLALQHELPLAFCS